MDFPVKSLLQSCLTRFDSLDRYLSDPLTAPSALTPEERSYFSDSRRRGNLPLRVPSHFLSLMGPGPDDPLRKQAVPRIQELDTTAHELSDPLGEDLFSPVPRLVHRYQDRVLLKMTDLCALNCRHCFRRRFIGGAQGPLTEAQADGAAAYLVEHPEVREVLLSGGDLFTLEDDILFDRILRLRAAEDSKESRRIFRLCSRIPLVMPERITDPLIRELVRTGPHWLVVQVNHPRELSPEAVAALGQFIDAGIPVVSQAVLLRGVNDEEAVLEELFRRLVGLRIKPTYLFQGDLARGTSHFRVPLLRGLEIMSRLEGRLSGLALPVYAVDLPGGGGKIRLTPERHEKEVGGVRYYRGFDGKLYGYPLEDV
jgi:lysine 2,3-aminomutase